MDDAVVFVEEEYQMINILNRIENISIKYGLLLK